MKSTDESIAAAPKTMLRQALEASGRPLKEVTVLAAQNDPFRLDTKANHIVGKWLADAIAVVDRYGIDEGSHLRGLHYAICMVPGGIPMPNGEPYINNDKNWLWLMNSAAKAARWLGYVPWERVVDGRTKHAPVIRIRDIRQPRGLISLGGLDIELPSVEDMEPYVDLANFTAIQPFRIVLFGEKQSLHRTLGQMADRYNCDLYLPTGEITDTLLHRMAMTGAEDGRPMVVLTFSDSDPSGWQMPISIGRKLQAFKTGLFPELQFRVFRAGLIPDQVRDLDLPSTPLKETEKRADKWKQRHGVEQTEIDALAALRPSEMEKMARNAICQFYDTTLNRRVREAKRTWRAAAQAVIDEAIGPEEKQRFRDEATQRLGELQEQIDELEDRLRLDPGDIDLPEIVVPQAITPPDPAERPLIDSRWDFVDQCDRLRASKEYRA